MWYKYLIKQYSIPVKDLYKLYHSREWKGVSKLLTDIACCSRWSCRRYANSTQCLQLCGLCLPLEEEEVQCGDQDLLSSRKMSVSRMHSLPNDSYMFRPVRPASAPYPLEEVNTSPQDQHSGNLSLQRLTVRLSGSVY